MRIYQALIIEDSPIFVELIKGELARIPFFDEPTVVTTTAGARQALKQKQFDLLLVDIELGGESSLSLFSPNGNFIPKIAITSHANYAVQCYDLGFSDYLIKPFTSERFMRAINMSMGIQINKAIYIAKDFIFLKAGRQYQRFSLNEIDYIEGYGIYSKLYSKQQITIVNESLASLVERLPDNQFMRVHKSFLVNIGNVTSYGHNQLHIGQLKVPIGQSYKQKFESFFQLFYQDVFPVKEKV